MLENYIEDVYAGVLGKVIGVYMGRPFEGQSKAKLEEGLPRFAQLKKIRVEKK